MHTSKIKINYSSSKGSGHNIVDIRLINKCPHCGAFMQATAVDNKTFEYNGEFITVVGLISNCCYKHFISMYCCYGLLGAETASTTEYLTTYPSAQVETLPASFSDLSERFVSLYNQSYTAELNNHLDLAATGYRNALEVLIKDYAIKKLKKPYDDVVKKSLCQAIKEYMPNGLLSNGANVVRILGNDYTHYENKYPQHDFDILKSFIKAFLGIMEFHLILDNPPHDLPI